MPRAFSEQEKAQIRSRLMAAGRECFTRYGLKKTTIEDLVKPARIAKASFYLFFDSKEMLYLELMMNEMPAMMQRLVDGSFGQTDNTRDALALLVRGIGHEILTNEFARIVFDDPSEVRRLAETMDFNDVLERATATFIPLVGKIAEAQARGEIIQEDPQQILYSLGLIKLIAFNRDKMPKELYESMMEFVPEVLANGLTYGCRAHDAPAEAVEATAEAKRRST